MPPKKKAVMGRGVPTSAGYAGVGNPQHSYYQVSAGRGKPVGSSPQYAAAGRGGVPSNMGRGLPVSSGAPAAYSATPPTYSSGGVQVGGSRMPVPSGSPTNIQASLPRGAVLMKATNLDLEKQLMQLTRQAAGKGPGSALGTQAATNLQTGYPAFPKHKRVYQAEIQKILVSQGCTKEEQGVPELLEDTAKHYVLDVLRQAILVSIERGGRLTMEDIAFQVRKDPERVNRLQKVMALKEVMKSRSGKEEDPEDIDEETKKEARAKRIRFSWEVPYGLSDGEDDQEVLLSDEEDNMVLSKKLDRKGKGDADYADLNDARLTIFTFKKLKKFKEWIDTANMDVKIGDDVVEALGVLASETVMQCVAGAIAIKAEMEGRMVNTMAAPVVCPPAKRGIKVLTSSSGPKVESLQLSHIQEYIRRSKSSPGVISGFTQAKRKYGGRVLAI